MTQLEIVELVKASASAVGEDFIVDVCNRVRCEILNGYPVMRGDWKYIKNIYIEVVKPQIEA